MKLKKIVYLNEINSTNDYAKKLSEDGETEGTVVIAKKQTHGRGRQGRFWLSPEGGLYLSIILKPNLTPKDALKITLLSAVAVASTIEELTSLACTLKWPNDVLLNNKKICGILSEAKFENDKPKYIIVGIGINVNYEIEKEYSCFLYPVTSLKSETGKEISLHLLAEKLLCQFENMYNYSMENGWREILYRWREKSNTIGREIKIKTGDSEISGYCKDIDENGCLIVKDRNENIIRVIEGDVYLI